MLGRGSDSADVLFGFCGGAVPVLPARVFDVVLVAVLTGALVAGWISPVGPAFAGADDTVEVSAESLLEIPMEESATPVEITPTVPTGQFVPESLAPDLSERLPRQGTRSRTLSTRPPQRKPGLRR